MSFIKWDSKYSVQNEKIDSQHKQLFSYVNQFDEIIHSENLKTCNFLFNKITNSEVKHNVIDMLNKLEGYTLTHF